MERSSDKLKCGPKELCFGRKAGARGWAATSLGHLKAGVDLQMWFWGRAEQRQQEAEIQLPGVRKESGGGAHGAPRGLNLEKTRLFSDLPRPSKS